MLCFGLADCFRFLNAKLDVLGAGRDEQEWQYIKTFATKKRVFTRLCCLM